MSRKDLETKLQHDILSAWLYTVHRKLGMFEEYVPAVNPLTLNDYDTIEHRSANVEPQDLWLKFLTERFNVVQYYSMEQVGGTHPLLYKQPNFWPVEPRIF